jgi:hypothetical protein
VGPTPQRYGGVAAAEVFYFPAGSDGGDGVELARRAGRCQKLPTCEYSKDAEGETQAPVAHGVAGRRTGRTGADPVSVGATRSDPRLVSLRWAMGDG